MPDEPLCGAEFNTLSTTLLETLVRQQEASAQDWVVDLIVKPLLASAARQASTSSLIDPQCFCSAHLKFSQRIDFSVVELIS